MVVADHQPSALFHLPREHVAEQVAAVRLEVTPLSGQPPQGAEGVRVLLLIEPLDGGLVVTLLRQANEVVADYRGGETLGVNSTPSLFINGTLYKGARSVEELDAAFAKLAK